MSSVLDVSAQATGTTSAAATVRSGATTAATGTNELALGFYTDSASERLWPARPDGPLAPTCPRTGRSMSLPRTNLSVAAPQRTRGSVLDRTPSGWRVDIQVHITRSAIGAWDTDRRHGVARQRICNRELDRADLMEAALLR